MVISRDHHDVSGTDSPFRETSNIYDGSAFTAGNGPSFSPLNSGSPIFGSSLQAGIE